MIRVEKQLRKIESLLAEAIYSQREYLNIMEASLCYKVPINTFYYYCNKKMIPYKKRGKRSYFKKSDLEDFFYKKAEYIKSEEELNREAERFFKNTK